MARALVALLVCGCGRIGFDQGTTDSSGGDQGPTGHDEDLDGIPDAIDVCPFISDVAQKDGDGDLVGDVCDPQPLLPAQRWVLFSPLTGDDPLLERTPGNWIVDTDTWNFLDDANQAAVVYTAAVNGFDAWMGFDLDALGTGGSQAAIVIREANNNPYWYGEVFDTGTGAYANLMTYDGTGYNPVDSQSIGPSLPIGSYVLHFRVESLGGNVRSDVSVPGLADISTMGATSYLRGDFVLLGFGNMVGKLRWVGFIEN